MRIFLVFAVCFSGLIACGSDDGLGDDTGDDDAATYPRQVDIEYKLSSSSGLTRANVFYTGETGGMTNEDNVTLPYSKKLSRTVDLYDSLSVAVSSTTGGSLDLAIVVEGATVDFKTYSGTSVVSGTSLYIFQ